MRYFGMENLYTVEEAAETLKIHPETLRDYLRDGKIGGVKLGRSWRLRETDLRAFVEARLIPAKQN